MNIRILIFSLIWIDIWGAGTQTNVTAQDILICSQNETYWERWQENADFRARMTGSMWNVTSFDISPDSATLVVANGDTLTLFDVQTLTPTLELESIGVVQGGNYGGSYAAVDWSPDGTQIAAAYFVSGSPDNLNPASGIQIWDVEQEQQVALLAGRPKAIAWSPDSSMLAEVDFSSNIWLWDVERGISSRLYEHKPLNGFSPNLLVWSPDAHYLAASDTYRGVLSLYVLGEEKPLILESPEKDIDYIVWSPPGDQLVMGNQLAHNLFMVDVSTDEITRTLNGGDGNPLDLQWSPDGAWLARGGPYGLYLWDMSSDDTTPARVLNEHMPPFVRMAWTPEGQSLISVDFEGSLYRWDVETGCVEAAFLKEWKPR